ncbi:sigma-70 family RNA polymerase sigma factor [Fuchsiella alkaliacetigena]|nr:sigma-70 family RNA polymerase sigma factor [Fuchsiella alkaliacetigena]
MKAIDTYDPSKQVKLATYASKCIENEILMYLRQNKNVKQEVLLQDPIGADKEGNELTLIDVLGTEANLVSAEVELNLDQEKLYEKMEKLTDRERKVIIFRYGLKDAREYTQREIADKLGISRSYVSRIEKKALKKLNSLF